MSAILVTKLIAENRSAASRLAGYFGTCVDGNTVPIDWYDSGPGGRSVYDRSFTPEQLAKCLAVAVARNVVLPEDLENLQVEIIAPEKPPGFFTLSNCITKFKTLSPQTGS